MDSWVSNITVLLLLSCENTYSPGEAFTKTFCSPWIGAEKNGIVICAHCDCMAGLGEACSHIAAI